MPAQDIVIPSLYNCIDCVFSDPFLCEVAPYMGPLAHKSFIALAVHRQDRPSYCESLI